MPGQGNALVRIRPPILLLILLLAPTTRAQVPGLPGIPASAEAKKDDPGTAPAPTKENPRATVAEAAGPIQVEAKVSDYDIERTLERVLPQYPGVRTVVIQVEDGVVDLRGQVRDDETSDRVRDFVRRVEGVRLVLNHTLTDAQVMTARELVAKQAGDFWAVIRRYWLLTIVAVGITLGGLVLGRSFTKYSDFLMSPFVENPLLRSVLGSLIAGLLGIGGFLLALKALDLTQVVLSVLGFASIIGLALGFAFRDIAENFIASVLLGLRRPFKIGDYVEVAGRSGLIKALNTRATVLVTLEGNHVRIPNSVIFKEIMVNHSSSPTVRNTFDVVVPYEASTASAVEAVARSLEGQEGILDDPRPRALVDDLGLQGVRIRAYFWLPSKGVDGLKIQSDARLRAKVALQQAGINLSGNSNVNLSVAGKVPVLMSRDQPNGQDLHPAVPGVTAAQAQANLHRDARAARAAALDAHAEAPAQQVLQEPESTVSDEGANLLQD
ncbi:MAG: mechanosensitive ion channel family protein [Isosphaeraceae bacterium]